VLSYDIWQKTGQAINNSNATTQTEWHIAKCGAALWAQFNVDSSGAPLYASPTASDVVFKPIAARTTGLTESMATFGGYMYFANGTDAMRRWDGRYYGVGWVECAGGTTVTGHSTSWNSWNSVRPGDKMMFYSTGAAAWVLTEYTVASITSDTSLELTSAGPNLAVSAQTFYSIVGMQNAGIDAPTEQLNLALNTSVWTTRVLDTSTSSSLSAFYSSVVVNSSGYPHAIYSQNGNELKRSYWDGSVWTTETILTVGTDTLYFLDTAIDASNNIYVCYVHGPTGSATLSWIKWNGTSWTAPATLDTTTSTLGIRRVAMGVDSDNHVHCAWIHINGATTTLKYSEYTTSWAAATSITTSVYPT
jgi:hypothetical protein